MYGMQAQRRIELARIAWRPIFLLGGLVRSVCCLAKLPLLLDLVRENFSNRIEKLSANLRLEIRNHKAKQIDEQKNLQVIVLHERSAIFATQSAGLRCNLALQPIRL